MALKEGRIVALPTSIHFLLLTLFPHHHEVPLPPDPHYHFAGAQPLLGPHPYPVLPWSVLHVHTHMIEPALWPIFGALEPLAA